jgi:dTDP-4-amino-4,6-dideoxygalactose transaminase
MRIKNLEKLLDKKYCFLTARGCTSLFLLLKTLKLKNKKIIIPANICHDVFMTIVISGNKPLPIDISNNYSLSYLDIKNNYDKNVGAILYPYMYGNVGNKINIKKTIDFARKKNVYFIEDLALSIGALYKKNTYVGSLSDYSICSFGVGKIIDLGYGGSINFNSEKFLKNFMIEKKKLKYYSKKELTALSNNFSVFSNKILNKKISKKKFDLGKIKFYKKLFVKKITFNDKYKINLTKQIKNIDITRNFLLLASKKFNKYLRNKYITPINHTYNSVYWRKNYFIKRKFDELIYFLSENKVYVRNYFAPLNYFFPFLKTRFNHSEFFYKHVVNFWLKNETKTSDIKQINNLMSIFYKK